MGSPGLDTKSRACRSVRRSVRVMAPPACPYLMALSSRTPISWRSLSASPVTRMSGAISLSRGFPASKATGSKARAQSVARSERETSPITAVGMALSARARVSISSTRDRIRLASEWMLSAHRAGRSSRGDASSSSALERITVRGVFSSWEASDRNCRCCRHAFATGAVAHRASRMETPSSSTSAAAPICR